MEDLLDVGSGDGGDSIKHTSTSNLLTWFNENEVTTPGTASGEDLSVTGNVLNAIDAEQSSHGASFDISPVFEAFIIIEIVMTTLELIVSVAAAIKIPRWRKNYRNQMLMQLSVVRFIKRLVSLIVYLKNKGTIQQTAELDITLLSCEIYIDFVIVFLVFFFIKHMYETLIVVLVKISENSLCKVLTCAWGVPLPISTACTAFVACDLLTHWTMYLLTCCLFKWPLMLLGTVTYFTILYRVLKDNIRRFARSLTVVTFLMCLIINFYLFSRDIIELWCLKSFSTILITYITGFFMNFLILCVYVVLIMLNFKSNIKISECVPNFSISVDR